MNMEAKAIELPALTSSDGQGSALLAGAQALPFVGHLKVKLTARIGEAELSLAELMALKAGSTVDLGRALTQPVDLLAEGHVIAQGTLVAVGDCFGLRLTSAPRTA